MQRSMESNFEYYFRCYALCFQVGLKLASQCEGLRHIIGISAPGCNLSQSPRLSYDDKGQVRRFSYTEAVPPVLDAVHTRASSLLCSAMLSALAAEHRARPGLVMLSAIYPGSTCCYK